MTLLLVEDLLLLTAPLARGRVGRPTGLALPRALAGAAVADLMARRLARLDGDRLVLMQDGGTPHRLLLQLCSRLAHRHDTLDGAIHALAAPRTRLGQLVLQSLADSGAVERHERRLLGVVYSTSHEVTSPDDVASLRTRVGAARVGPVDDPHMAALARIVSAGGLARAVHIEAAPRRGRPMASAVASDPVAAAVARTVQRARRDAATTGAVAATAGAVVASGS